MVRRVGNSASQLRGSSWPVAVGKAVTPFGIRERRPVERSAARDRRAISVRNGEDKCLSLSELIMNL